MGQSYTLYTTAYALCSLCALGASERGLGGATYGSLVNCRRADWCCLFLLVCDSLGLSWWSSLGRW